MKKQTHCLKIALAAIVTLFVFYIYPVFSQEKSAVLGKEEKTQFIEKLSKALNERYVFPEVAKEIEKHINKQNSDGFFEKINEPKEFAEIMTKELQSISHDKHMRVFLRPAPPIKTEKEDPVLESIFRNRKQMESNYSFVKVEVLKGNIGYVDFRAFVDLQSGRETAASAMKFLSNTYAIIFDLRKNGGGSPEMIRYICSYFFDKPTHLNSIYWRNLDRTVEFWTSNDIEGKKMTDIPLYVLTSHYTFSGAEEFSYNMQTQKRATIIGEITGGGANPGGTTPIGKHFAVFIPNGRAINPVTKTNWEGVGVKPDIEVPEDKAYDIALEKAKVAAEKYAEEKKKEIAFKWSESKSLIEKAEKLFEAKKNNEAEQSVIEGLEKALKNGFINETFINNMGYGYLGNKDYNMAIAILKFNVSAFPKSFNTFDSLGEAYMNSGDKDLAIKNYKKSVELNPDNTGAKEAIKKIEGK